MARRVVRFLSIGLLIVTTLLIPSTSTAQWDDYVIVQPSRPTEADEISITVGGVWADSCIPQYDDHSILGNTIAIDAVSGAPPGVACAPVITPWEFTTHIGHLPVGSYTVELYISSLQGEEYPPRLGYFSVLPEAASIRLYLPLVMILDEDPSTLRQIGFDAVRWELESPCAPTATPTATPTPTATGTPPPGTIIVDDLDDGFIRHGTPEYWQESSIGYEDHMFWTYVNGSTIDNWAEWHPGLLPCGFYRVSVFVPCENATTQSARYEVCHADDTETVVVKQIVYFDEWVTLGTYRFGDSAEEHVRLTDATGEDPSTLRQIGFDAVKWELESPCLYLPIVVKDYST